MNKNYTSIIVLITILFFGALSAQETQKNFINYQGVARNASNELMVSEAMTVTIGLKFGGATAPAEYEENHSITTDANGVFSLLIGNGSSTRGNYNTLAWGSAATFVTVSMNGTEIGTTEMMAVPYAISAGSMKDPSATEVRYDNSTSGLTANTAQDAIDELVTGGSVDADADPSNEFQMLSFDAVTNELSLSDGNAITIPSGGTDADADPTNEIQTISFDAGTNELSLTDGGVVTIPSGGTDADADPTNEIQMISFDAASNKISLTDGGEITIPSGGTDADADPTNELQDISLSGTELTITDGATIDLASIVPPGGTDNQELTFDETTKMLEIEDGNTVDLSSLAGSSGSSLWSEVDGHINYDTGRVGIGTGANIPVTRFEIAGIPGVSEEVGFTNALFTITDNEFGGGPFRLIMGGSTIQTTAEGALSSLRLNPEGGNILTGSGNLGVGISPTSKLDVNGTVRSRDLEGTGDRNVMADADGNLVIGAGGEGSSLWTESFGNISYDAGSVGIGTDSPERNTALHVRGKMFLESPGGLYLGDPDFGAQWLISKGSFDRNDLIFWSNSESEGRTQRSRIAMRRSGEFQVGRTGIIGAGWLNVINKSTVSKPHIKIQEIEDDYARLEFKNASAGFWHIAGRGGATGDVSRLNFYHHDGTSGRDYMTIAGSGNVGIGTAEPTAKLEVRGDIKTTGEIHRASTGTANMVPIAYGTIRGNGAIASGSGNFSVQKVSTGDYRITITGENFFFADYTAIASLITGPGFIDASSVSGTLTVGVYNTSGTLADGIFTFVVYKP